MSAFLIRSILQLQNAQRQAVDENHRVWPAVMLAFNDRELVHCQPIVCVGVIEIHEADNFARRCVTHPSRRHSTAMPSTSIR